MKITKSQCWHCNETLVEYDNGGAMHTRFAGSEVEPYKWCRQTKATPKLGTSETMTV